MELAEAAEAARTAQLNRVPALRAKLYTFLAKNIDVYVNKEQSLLNYIDGYSVAMLLKEVGKHRRVPNWMLKQFLVSCPPALDLTGILVEESSLRAIGQMCPNLQSLCMSGCYTSMTDTNLDLLLRKCKKIQDLDLSGCSTQLPLHSTFSRVFISQASQIFNQTLRA
jgi:hypothetical protein